MKFDLQVFQALIKARCGLLFEGNGEEKLTQALHERATALGLQATDYYAKLLASEAEFQELVSLLTVNETYFFREPEQIRLLVERLAPRLLVARGGLVPLRILSAGCSSGEEPYSLVMALMEKYGESANRLFEFVGGDIDRTVLARARLGRYSDFSFRGVSASIKQRYFDRVLRDNLLKPQVKAQVKFVELNLLSDHYAPELRDFDIIFFRNVSIYFDTPTRKTIQRNLANLLKSNGVLVIGTAETLANDLGVLPLVEEDGLFYFVKGQPPAAAPFNALTSPFSAAPQPATAAWQPPPAAAVNAWVPDTARLDVAKSTGVTDAPRPLAAQPLVADADSALVQARQLTQDKRFDAALPHLDAVLHDRPDHVEATLLKAHVLINRKDFAAAQALAERVLASDAWSVDALLLLGLAAKWRGQLADAIRWFKQAAYARHECWPAHYYLADLHRSGDDIEPARRAYRVVLQLLSAAAPDAGIRHVPLDLPAGEVRFLCEHQLAKLAAAAPRAMAR